MDIKKARELLEKAGYPQGLEVKLYFSPDRYPKAKEVCQVIADQLAKAGIKVELVSQEFVIFWGKEGVNGGKLPFYYVGRPEADADTVYDQYYRSGVTPRVQYKNPSSTSSSTRSKKPAMRRNAWRYCSRPAVY